MAQWGKDLALSLQRLGPLLWGGLDPQPGERPHAVNAAEKEEKRPAYLVIRSRPLRHHLGESQA